MIIFIQATAIVVVFIDLITRLNFFAVCFECWHLLMMGLSGDMLEESAQESNGLGVDFHSSCEDLLILYSCQFSHITWSN